MPDTTTTTETVTVGNGPINTESVEVTKVTKPGWITSEFWVTVLPLVGVFLLMALGRITVEQAVSLWPLLLSGGVYSVGRGIAKQG